METNQQLEEIHKQQRIQIENLTDKLEQLPQFKAHTKGITALKTHQQPVIGDPMKRTKETK